MAGFDEARAATEDMFALPETDVPEDMGQIEAAAVPEVNAEVVPEDEVSEAVTHEQQAVETSNEAVNTAEAAMAAAQEKDNELQQVLSKLQEIEAQNSQLRNAIAQMSQQQEEAIVNGMTQQNAAPVYPELDVSSLAFDDEEVVKQKQADYARQMTDFVREELMRELAPVLDEARAGMREKERAEIYDEFSQVPQLSGIRDMSNEVEGIIRNNPVIANADIPAREKYMLAYTIAKGVNSINNPIKPPTSDELMGYYDSNPEFRDMVERKRIEALNKSQQVPPMSASSGASSAALNIKEKPKSFEEASERTRHMFSPRR